MAHIITTAAWTLDEVDGQLLEVLPTRDTLYGLVNVNPTIIVGVNLAFAINAASIGTSATALANQVLVGMH